MANRTAPNVSDPTIKRALDDIYNILNDILGTTNYEQNESLSPSAGKLGDFKAVKDYKNKTYKIAGKTREGWVSVPAYLQTGTKGFDFKLAEFNLTKYDKIEYKDTVFSILNDQSGLNPSIKIGSTNNYSTFSTTDTGDLTIATVGAGTTDSDLTLDVDGDIELNADGGQVHIKDGATSHFTFDCDNNRFRLFHDADSADFFNIVIAASGATIISTIDDGAAVGHLTLLPDGDLILDPVSQKIIINATDGLYFDGGTHTSISESSDDVLRIGVGGDVMIQLSEKGDDGNEVHFGSSCVGFTQLEPTYDATTTIVDFRHSNKQFLTFGSGSITNLLMYFPLVSGNFVLLVKQDGTGSRTITNWKVFEFDETSADGSIAVKFAGGSNPTLTTDANHVDILSFYWDADNEIAYGVATLDFQF
jgi:hypothetical protein